MNDVLRAILRQLLVSNQIKLVEFSDDPLKSDVHSDKIKIWNDAIKFDLEECVWRE